MMVLAKSIRALNDLVRAPPKRKQAKVISESGLFDIGYYLATDGLDRRALNNPVMHFIRRGAALGRKPHPFFNPLYYGKRNPDVADFNCLYHYIVYGQKEGRWPHPLFDQFYYAAQDSSDLAAANNPLLHFTQFGHLNRRSSHPLFDVEYYLQANPTVAGSGVNPLRHFLEIGAAEGLTPHRLFDPAYYLKQCPDAVGSNPLLHYLEHAIENRLNPHRAFDTGYYLETNPDVAEAGAHPLVHFVVHGGREGRKPRPRSPRVLPLADSRERNPAARTIADAIPLETNSRHVALRMGNTKTLDVVFSLGRLPEGEFSLSDVPTGNTQIFLNTRQNDSYQRGIPGMTATIDETARWLQRVIDHLRPTAVRTMGESMGGYAALLFGHLLSADAIYATAPFVQLGQPYCRSLESFVNATYDRKFQDITQLLPRIEPRGRIVFPTFDLPDYRHMQHFHGWAPHSLFHCPGLHPGGHCMNWETVIGSPDLLNFCDGITWGRRYVLVYTRPQMDQIWNAYVAIRRREHAAALKALMEIAAIDPLNYGVLYRIGVEQALVGEVEAATRTLRPAMEGLWETTDISANRRGYLERWRLLIAADYTNVADLGQLKALVNLFHQVWPDELLVESGLQS